MAGPRLSVVVPVYNEARVLEASLARLHAFLRALGEEFEVVCVDDGSRDGSAEILVREEASSRVRAITHPENRGKGAAVRTGCLAARGERVVFMDADLSTELDSTRALLEALDAGADVALGSRRAPNATIAVRQPKLRELLGVAFSRLAAAAIDRDVRDFTCGFKGFRAAAARTIFERARIERWAFDAEVIAIARVHGLRIAQVPVRWQHQPDSKVRVARAAVGSFLDLCRIAAWRSAGRYR
jgi:dolichyl-phosphate beta-glucosyltransferase